MKTTICIFQKRILREAIRSNFFILTIERGELRSPKYPSKMDESRVYTKSLGRAQRVLNKLVSKNNTICV